MKKQINFRVERDFSESISTTFDFLRYNFKMIMKLTIRIPGPLVLLGILLIIPYYISLYDKTISGEFSFDPVTLSLFGLGMLVYLIASILGMASINEFIRLYQSNESPELITVKEVYSEIKNKFRSYLGAYFLVGIIAFAGFIVFFIPGMYLAIALLLTFTIITNENISVTLAISRSFKLIKGNWWATFGLLIVLSFLTVFITYVFALPITFIAGYLVLQPELGWITSFFYALINSVTLIVTFFTTVIYYIAINIKYFSLVEQKDQVGLKEQIEEMNAERVTEE